jgi:hypothetical protein
MGKTNQFDAMATQIKALTEAITKLTATRENKDPNASRSGGKNESRRPQMTKLQNMGAYCHSHGFHPVGTDHDSAQLEKLEHKTEAIWGNCLGGDTFWSSAKRVAIKQQDHPTW